MKNHPPNLPINPSSDIFKTGEAPPFDERPEKHGRCLEGPQTGRKEAPPGNGKGGRPCQAEERPFGIPDEMNLLVGTLSCTRSGNGFVVPDKEEGSDVFVPARFIKDAIHGDKVVVRIEHMRRRKREGRIVKVTERKTKNITGFLRQHKIALLPRARRREDRRPLYRGPRQFGRRRCATGTWPPQR